MRTLEWTTINKSNWPRGQWDNEPDKKQWLDQKTGYPCLIKRTDFSGHLCGYVGVSEGHPAFNKYYADVPVNVHGGLTYSDFCMDVQDESKGICHSVEKGENDRVWWLGFDCAHLYDEAPNKHHYGVYRDFSYVTNEIESLAKQLKQIAETGRLN